jgi:hypothetical protein
MNRRGVAAGVVLGAWAIGLGVLVKREYFRPHLERLAEAALRVSPGVVYFGVTQGDRQIGFASSTIDTAANTITSKDYLVADIPVGGKVHRATAKTDIELTRTLRVRQFSVILQGDAPPIRANGRIEGDSMLVLAIASGASARADTQRIRVDGPVLLPTLIPLAIALGEPAYVRPDRHDDEADDLSSHRRVVVRRSGQRRVRFHGAPMARRAARDDQGVADFRR